MADDNTCKTDNAQKIVVSLWATLIFILISSRFMYGITNSIGLKTLNKSGFPSAFGFILHAVVFAVLIYLSMFLSLPKV